MLSLDAASTAWKAMSTADAGSVGLMFPIGSWYPCVPGISSPVLLQASCQSPAGKPALGAARPTLRNEVLPFGAAENFV